MTIRFNGTELEEVRFNGVDCEKVYFNGVLVFEKAAGERILTVGTIQSGAWGDYGYRADAGKGAITPNVLATPKGEYFIEYLYWSGAGGDTPMGMIGLEPATGGTPRFWDHYSAKVHIGGNTIDFNAPNNGFTYLSYALFANLPKSGTHPILIEAIP